MLGYFLYKWRYKRELALIKKFGPSKPGLIKMYRARYGDEYIIGELYIYVDSIRFEKQGLVTFDIPTNTLQKVLYSKQSLQLVMNDGRTHLLRQLREAPELEGPLFYTVGHGMTVHTREALAGFLKDMQLLNIPSEPNTIPAGRYYRGSIAGAIFALVGFIFLALGQFVFGWFD